MVFTFNVGVTGEYLVSVKFNDQHIPDSPFKVFIAPGSGDARKLTVTQLHDQGLQVLICFINLNTFLTL